MAGSRFGMLRRTIRLNEKFSLVLSTVCFVIRYFPFLRGIRHLRVQWGSVVRQFWDQEAPLSIRLEGNNRIGRSCLFQGTGDITVGKNTFFGDFCVIGSNERIQIGRDVMISQAVTIRDTDHNFESLETPMNVQGMKTAAVHIEDDVWIGHGAIILKGVSVGEGAVVAAGAVVAKDVPKFAIVAGLPARVVKYRTLAGSAP
jgi:acetyltransferase-like isoleucine patch superfamily enzyme